jgi:glyoxylase-like metal-dependent hydrolase (beta-lactamase superfamily II)
VTRAPTPVVECRVLDTGYCLATENFMMRGGSLRPVHCHSVVALLRHPEHGWLLFDTGYAPRILEATGKMPFRLYRLATPMRVSPELAAASQLARFNVDPSDIGYVVISHFHADHIAGLLDFPRARFVALRAAYEDVAPRRGLNALRRAFIPSLMPPDFASRATLLPPFSGPPLPGLGPTHDLFGDGSLLLVSLPGHALGQIGMLANTGSGPVLLAADGCWLTRQVRERRPPGDVTRIFIDDMRAARSTIARLHAFMRARPDVRVVPSHCPEAFAREVGHAP